MHWGDNQLCSWDMPLMPALRVVGGMAMENMAMVVLGNMVTVADKCDEVRNRRSSMFND